MTIQVPPAVGSSGQFLESFIVSSSQNRQAVVVGDAASTATLIVSSSGGGLVQVTNPSTAVTITNPTTAVSLSSQITVATTGTLIVLSASSGLVQISGTPTIVSASSGLVQTLSSGTILLSSAGLTQIFTSSSNPLLVNVAGSSGTIALVSSAGSLQVITTASASGSTGVSVFGFGTTAGSTGTQTQAIVTTSGALLVSGTPGSVSTAVNLLTSSGGFYLATTSQGLTIVYSSVPTVTATGPVTITSGLVSVTSGTFTLSSNPTVITASSGFASVALLVTSTAGYGPVTSSAGQLVSVSSGTFTLSSNPTVVSASSGLIQLTSNITVISASSGLVQISGVPLVAITTSQQSLVTLGTTAPAAVLVTSSAGPAFSLGVNTAAGYGPVTSSQGQLVTLYGGTSARLTVMTTVTRVSTGPGVLSFISVQATSTSTITAYARLYDQTTGNATSANNAGLAGAAMLFKLGSSGGDALGFSQVFPQGVKFATACSVDVTLTATSTAATIGGWLTAQYTT